MLHRHRIEFVVVACLVAAAAIVIQRAYFPLHPIAYQAVVSKASPRDYRALDADGASTLVADGHLAGLQQLYCQALASSIASALDDEFIVAFGDLLRCAWRHGERAGSHSMSAAFVTAWIVIAAIPSGQAILAKQIRIDPVACHLPAIKAEYPVDGKWAPVTVRIRC
jgi:hypothetical protein